MYFIFVFFKAYKNGCQIHSSPSTPQERNRQSGAAASERHMDSDRWGEKSLGNFLQNFDIIPVRYLTEVW